MRIKIPLECHGIQEASGSIPLISTNSREWKIGENVMFSPFFLYFSEVFGFLVCHSTQLQKAKSAQKSAQTPKKECKCR